MTVDLPKEYDLNFLNSGQSMYVFTETEQGEAIGIQGKIEHECQIRPKLNDEYRALMERRNRQAIGPKRTVKLVQSVEKGVQVGTLAHVSEAELLSRKRRRHSPDSRRDRLPKPELLDILFKLFERKSNWTLKSLIDSTQQPAAFLREVLSEICDYIQRGPLKNTFKLKSEFNEYSEEKPNPQSSEDELEMERV